MQSTFGKLIILLTWLAALPAVAQEYLLFSNPHGGSGTDVRVPMLSEEQCRETLEGVYSPKAVVAKALDALAAVEDLKSSVNSCLDELPKNPQKAFPGEFALRGSFDSERYQLPYPPLNYDLTRHGELQKKVSCYIQPGTNEAYKKQLQQYYKETCDGYWFESPEEYKSLKEEYGKEREKYELAQLKYQQEKNVGSTIYQVLRRREVRKEIDATAEEFRARLNCTLPANEALVEQFKTNWAKHCDGKWLTPDEAKVVREEQAAWLKDLQQQRSDRETWNRRLAELLRFHGSLEGLDRGELVELAKLGQCENFTFQGGWDYHERVNNKKRFCGERDWLTPEEHAGVVQTLREKLGDLEARIEGWEDTKKKLIEAADRRYQELNQERAEQYALLRLLAAHRAAVKAGNHDIKSFCKHFRARDERDNALLKHKPAVGPFSGDRGWKFAAEHGLSETEFGAIQSYMGSYYGDINPPLFRGEPLNEKLKAYKEVMDAGLAKLPIYKGQVRRHLDLPESVLAQHKVGATVCYKAYTSTSKKPDWDWGGKVRMFIQPAKRGRAVFEISDSEGEVLFDSGTCFKVVGRSTESKNKSSYHRIVLQEVDGAKVPADAWNTQLKEAKAAGADKPAVVKATPKKVQGGKKKGKGK